MMLSCNRFAFIPHLCLECKRYIWLEGYRRAEVWKKICRYEHQRKYLQKLSRKI